MLPVAGDAESLQLMQYCIAGLPLPFPNPFDKLHSPDLSAGQSDCRQAPLDHILCSYARVISSRNPKNPVAVHSFVTAEYILERVVERMAHMQGARDIRGWDNHGKTGTFSACRSKRPQIHP